MTPSSDSPVGCQSSPGGQHPPGAVYGPVTSWRLGRSLGIDLLLQTSICSFNCIYCQLGQIQKITTTSDIFVPTADVVANLQRVDWAGVDVVTFSGSGEPTLALNLGDVIDAVKAMADRRVIVLSNSTRLYDPDTRKRLRRADEVVCKLDAATQETFQRFNRPAPGLRLEAIIEGILQLRGDYSGTLALQCMFMPINLSEAPALARIAARMHPDEIQINTPRRPYPRNWNVALRGAHGPAESAPDSVRLKTISEEDVCWVAGLFREACPQAKLLTPLDRPPTPSAP